MCTGAIEIKVDVMEVLNDIAGDLPFIPSSRNLKVFIV